MAEIGTRPPRCPGPVALAVAIGALVLAGPAPAQSAAPEIEAATELVQQGRIRDAAESVTGRLA